MIDYMRICSESFHSKYSKVLRSLIGNMGELTFSIDTPTTKWSHSSTFEEETDYFSCTETLERRQRITGSKEESYKKDHPRVVFSFLL